MAASPYNVNHSSASPLLSSSCHPVPTPILTVLSKLSSVVLAAGKALTPFVFLAVDLSLTELLADLHQM